VVLAGVNVTVAQAGLSYRSGVGDLDDVERGDAVDLHAVGGNAVQAGDDVVVEEGWVAATV
jgi:hypothetical protein